MSVVRSSSWRPVHRRLRPPGGRGPGVEPPPRWVVVPVLIAALVGIAYLELRTSFFQARLLAPEINVR